MGDWNEVLDVVVAVLMVAGSLMSLAAAWGLLVFPDLLTRMHAATKPQVLGLFLLLSALVLSLRKWELVPLVLLVWIFQLLTVPVGAHMVGRAGYRTRHVDRRYLEIDDLRSVVNSQVDKEPDLGGQGAKVDLVAESDRDPSHDIEGLKHDDVVAVDERESLSGDDDGFDAQRAADPGPESTTADARGGSEPLSRPTDER